MSIDELTRLIPPPEKPTELPANRDWQKVEADLGFKLPTDYKDYVEAYGTGRLGEFVRVNNPFSPSEYTNLKIRNERDAEIFRTIRESAGPERFPFGTYPDTPGLLGWGTDDNGNWLFWLTEGAPDDWPCIAFEGRGYDWQMFKMPMTSFLTKTLSGELICDIWPDDVADPDITIAFEPWEEES